MRFAHLSDSHLGHKQFGLFERETDFYDVFAKNIDKIIEKDVDFVIHSGDLFDNNRPPTEALIAFQKALIRLKEAKISIYAIAGNHDSILREGSLPPQVIFKDIGLKLISPDNPAYMEGGVLICGIPYTASINSKALKNTYGQLSKIADKYLKSILVSHQGIDKWMYEHSFEVELNEMPKNFDYYAMGHIHNYIEEDFGKGKLVFPGSMEIMRSSENNENYRKFGKGFVVVDLSDEKPQIERVKIDLPREFIQAVINYDKFYECLPIIKKKIQSLDNKPMLELSVVGGDFSSAEIYDAIKTTLRDDVLILRPRFKPDEANVPDILPGDEVLDPIKVLYDKVCEKYGEDEGNLSVKLLEDLSLGKVDDAKVISDVYYREHYYNLEESDLQSNQSKMKKSDSESASQRDESDSLEDYLDNNLDDSYNKNSEYNNQKSKQMSFDDF